MKVLILNGNPKKDGFVAGCLDRLAAALASGGAETETVRLADGNIRDCIGCFQCLRSGECPLRDDVPGLIARMTAADGFVIGAPVRNGATTACYKRFLERITYLLGFSLALEDKYTLALSSVGFMGGRGACREHLGLQGPFHTRLSGVVFRAVGMPPKVTPADLAPELDRAARRLIADIASRRPRSAGARLSFAVDRFVVGRFMLRKQPDLYAYIIECWKRKGYL